MNRAFTPITVHASETPVQRNRALQEALVNRDLSGKWLYDTPAQAQLWLAYHQACSPSRTDASLRASYGQAFEHAVSRRGGYAESTAIHAISLGCGGGLKDRALMDAVRRLGNMAAGHHYSPLDTSPALVLEAAETVAAAYPEVAIHPLVADLAQSPELDGWIATQDGGAPARLITCFGMVPNFEPVSFLAYLHTLLRPGDGLLISANLSPRGFPADRELILPQYDNPPARRWYWGLLDALGFPPAHLLLGVEGVPLAADGSYWRVEARASVRKRFALEIGGQPHTFAKGESLRLFYSNRFTLQGIRVNLAAAGLEIREQWIHTNGEEGIFYCQTGS